VAAVGAAAAALGGALDGGLMGLGGVVPWWLASTIRPLQSGFGLG
jgi:ABC-type nitrate/sulfonate/bicarbonate transport system substrate-binding protein